MSDIKIADVIAIVKRFLLKFNKLEEKEADEFLLNMSMEEILEIYLDIMKLILRKEVK